MALAHRLTKENLKNVNLILELADARAPLSSRNPIAFELIKKIDRIVVLTKADLSDVGCSLKWVRHFEKTENCLSLAVNCFNRSDIEKLKQKISSCKLKSLVGNSKLVQQNRIVRAMVVGVPNVGKSALINSLIGRRKVKVENRPGVTKAAQWVKAGSGLDLLDLPGTLQVKFKDPATDLILAAIGCVKENEFDEQEVCLKILENLTELKEPELEKKFGEKFVNLKDPFKQLEMFCEIRGMKLKGGEANLQGAAKVLIKDFQKGLFGRVTLEKPE